MSKKCAIYNCDRPAEICGYCLEDYERDITPFKCLTKQQLLEFIRSVQFILSREFHLSLPGTLNAQSVDSCSKDQLREMYRETKRFLDTYLRHKLLHDSYISDRPDLHDGSWKVWEEICQIVARELFGTILIHPRLPNNTMPDIVPYTNDLCLEHTKTGRARLQKAHVIVEIKSGISHPEVLPKYGNYAKRVEVWFYFWHPRGLPRLEEGVVYQSPIGLAHRLEQKESPQLASMLRSLPLLWRDYELLPHYTQGLPCDG